MKPAKITLCLIFLILLSANTEAGKSNAFDQYYCKSGFHLEKSGDQYQCIQPAKISYRRLQNCNSSSANTLVYALVTDAKNHQDRCIIKSGPSDNFFKPRCQQGYSVKVKRGKDACSKLQSRVIITPLIRLKQKKAIDLD